LPLYLFRISFIISSLLLRCYIFRNISDIRRLKLLLKAIIFLIAIVASCCQTIAPNILFGGSHFRSLSTSTNCGIVHKASIVIISFVNCCLRKTVLLIAGYSHHPQLLFRFFICACVLGQTINDRIIKNCRHYIVIFVMAQDEAECFSWQSSDLRTGSDEPTLSHLQFIDTARSARFLTLLLPEPEILPMHFGIHPQPDK